MSKSIGKKGLELIKLFNICRLKAHKKPSGKYVIGYNHNDNVTKDMTITQEGAEELLKEDIKKYADMVDDENIVPFTKYLNDNQRDALICFAFNCGIECLKTLCNNKKVEDISEAILFYDKSGGKVIESLKNKRKAERALFITPISKEVDEAKTITPLIEIADGGKIKVSITKSKEIKNDDIEITQPTPIRSFVVKAANREEIIWTQEVLTKLGYFNGNIDGISSFDLHNAVIAFQANYNLVTNGVIEANTVEKIKLLLNNNE